MHVRILLGITADGGPAGPVEEIAVFEKTTERVEDLGLSIAEAKLRLKAAQTRTATAQAAGWFQQNRCCNACGQPHRIKGSNPIVFRTLYGDVKLRSPRLHRGPMAEPADSGRPHLASTLTLGDVVMTDTLGPTLDRFAPAGRRNYLRHHGYGQLKLL